MPKIGQDILAFVRSIDGLEASFPLITDVVGTANEKAENAYFGFLAEHGRHVGKKDGRHIYELDLPYQHKVDNLEKHKATWGSAVDLLPKSLLISLVSQYDAFLRALLGHLFYSQPGLLNLNDQNLPFPKLLELGSVEKAKEFFIEKQVEGVLRSSHSEQFCWMENKFKLPLREGLSLWPDFIELTERRNLFVHCNGIVSSQYLSVCKDHNVSLPASISLGKKLEVSKEYFHKAHRCLFEIAIKLAHVLWRKIIPNNRLEADSNLLEITYEALVAERYELAAILLDFATSTLKHYSNDEMRRLFILNRAIAYKWAGDDKKCRVIVNEHDWSSSREKFRLAVAVLLEDYPEAVRLMKVIGPTGDPSEFAYRDWPLFRKFRTSPLFLRTYHGFYPIFTDG